jgi:ketosteroid isomerase-like protein
MASNLDTVRASYDAFHRRDVDGILAALAPDVRWTHPDGMSPFGLGGTKNGHAEVVDFLKQAPKHVAELKLEPEEFLESGDRIVVFGRRRVTGHTGRSAVLRFVHSWRFDAGRATDFEDYFDTAEFIGVIAD